MSDPTLALLEQLMACPSLTPEDAGCQDILAARLAACGFAVEFQTYGSVRNLWARRGTVHPLLCFAGHTDVVPSGPREHWQSDPFVPTRREGMLYGRGASDMKSSLAAFVTAVEHFLAVQPTAPLSLAVLLTSDEEGPAVDGTVRVLETLAARGEAIDWCIVGEPTSNRRFGDTVKNGRRGSLSGRLTVRGVQGHIAYPHRVKNPIHLLAPALAELAATEWDRGNDWLPPTSWQASNIHAGTGASNVVPGELELHFNFRFSTASSVESLQHRMEACLARHALNYTLEWSLGGEPYLSEPGTLCTALRAAIHAETGEEAEISTSGGTSDGRFIARHSPLGAARPPQVVEFGPLNHTAHKIDECVSLADLPRLSAIYRRTLETLVQNAVSAR